MDRGWLLGLDVGTTRIKAVMIDDAGVEQASASVATPFATVPAPEEAAAAASRDGRPAPARNPLAGGGGIEMGVADLGRALGAVLAALGPARARVAAVGVTGMAESGAPLREGRALAPVIAWHDGRGEETVASLEGRFGPDLARWTGRRVRTVSSVAKLGWLVDHGLPAPDRWLGVPELVLFLLTGAEATEHSLAARTGAYHVTERRWLPDVIERACSGRGAARGLFPPVRRSGEAMGFVTGEAAAGYGLAEGIPVTIAGHDHLAAAAGLGGRPDDLFNSVGTAETLVRRLDAVPDVDRALELDLTVTLWPGGHAWGVLASAARSGLVIDALTARLGAARVAAPGAMVELGQGIEVPDGPEAEMWTATLEALARRTGAAAERIAALAGPPRRLVVFGGGSRNRAWLQAKAAVLGLPVVACPVAEAAARGAALAAGVAAGWWAAPGAGPTPGGQWMSP